MYAEKITALATAMNTQEPDPKTVDEITELFDRQLAAIPNFFNSRFRMGWASQALKKIYDGKEYRDNMQDYHDRCADMLDGLGTSMNQIDKWCSRYHTEPVFGIDTKDRGRVTDAAEKFIGEMFDEADRIEEKYFGLHSDRIKHGPKTYPTKDMTGRAARRLPDTLAERQDTVPDNEFGS